MGKKSRRNRVKGGGGGNASDREPMPQTGALPGLLGLPLDRDPQHEEGGGDRNDAWYDKNGVMVKMGKMYNRKQSKTSICSNSTFDINFFSMYVSESTSSYVETSH
mmetsp:Transcript_20221/g.58005  ORF Transcript_20221/g.58005 Transcript_20221/m.58005 type:complete len:106 (+) Transcript_20221:205-522(+)